MSFTPAIAGHGTLADALPGRSSLARSTALVTAGVGLMAVLAQVSIPMWPVPITGQTLGVVLVAASLGLRRGTVALAAYTLVGLAGLPVFSDFTGGPAAVMKPSFGFILGFIAAAAVIGAFADRGWDRSVWRASIAFTLGSVIPFLFGLPYLALMLGVYDMANDPATVISLGLLPFIPGGIVKAAIAAVLLPLTWRAVKRIDRSA